MKDLSKARPREVEAYLREKVRWLFGNEIEDKARIYSSHGFYSIELMVDRTEYIFRDFRKTETSRIVKALRALSEKRVKQENQNERSG